MVKLTIEGYPDSGFSGSPLKDTTFVADFNPTDYTWTRSNDYVATPTPHTSRPKTKYDHGNNDQLKIAFMFDGTGVNDAPEGMPKTVLERVERFLGLLRFRGRQHIPPHCKVMWGGFTFQGVLKSASANFVLFDKQGVPLRAKISAEFEQVVSRKARIAEEKKSSPDVDRVWVVQAGDRLDRIAFESYGHVAYWRQLAFANGLANPRSLEPGRVLSLPLLELV
ncbi:CIS tube protein [Engelhardtia mirabilis]|uniref:LysM domain-containing protein n=1 Tax=Engelhardtia mirabilis TaxID=2528011 RepID=A0A518BPP0_9BACT|nr:hypothetical protein Pla133_40500 [Planctomycetes bacterium Pla133]QDV03262.1 hypothetical protein Pla86_40490 [Planctomycetes bacterium Pla86]